MIRKSGYRFSEKIMLKIKEEDQEIETTRRKVKTEEESYAGISKVVHGGDGGLGGSDW